jgi:hypothetical protein
MSYTGSDIVYGALRVITSISPGEAIPGGEADNALSVLNGMLAAWSAESLMPPFRTLENFPLVNGQASYTIGSGADFDTVRPDAITYAYRRNSGNLDFPLTPLTQDEYNAERLKTLAGLPQWYHYDCQYPNGVIYVYPVESQADTLYIESLKPFNRFANLQVSMALPGEYFECMKYQLARRLAPEYGFPITPDMLALMDDAYSRIKKKNTKRKVARFDAALMRPRPFNIVSG